MTFENHKNGERLNPVYVVFPELPGWLVALNYHKSIKVWLEIVEISYS
jgi:hypothetical protein